MKLPVSPAPLAVSWIDASSQQHLTHVDALLRQFDETALPREQWTHAAHLVVGLWCVRHLGVVPALEYLCIAIDRYNRATGRTPAERDGFSREVTRTWVDRIAAFQEEHRELAEEEIFRKLLESAWNRSGRAEG